MRCCPLCLRVYVASRDRCPRHGPLEEVSAVALADRIASREGPLAPEDALALLRAALALDPSARGELSPKRIFVRDGADAPLALVGIDGESKPDPLDDALHDPLSRDASSDADNTQRYRFAALAFELLSGEAPFAAKTPRAVEVRKRLEPPPSLRARRADVSEAFSEALAAALARPREQTGGASAEALVDSLARAIEPAPAVRQAVSAPQLIAAAAPAPPASFAPPARSSRGALGCGALLAGLAMIAGLAMVFTLSSKRSPQSDKQSASAIPRQRESQPIGGIPAPPPQPQPIAVAPMVPQSTPVAPSTAAPTVAAPTDAAMRSSRRIQQGPQRLEREEPVVTALVDASATEEIADVPTSIAAGDETPLPSRTSGSTTVEPSPIASREPAPRERSPWPYVAGAAVAIGGLAAALLLLARRRRSNAVSATKGGSLASLTATRDGLRDTAVAELSQTVRADATAIDAFARTQVSGTRPGDSSAPSSRATPAEREPFQPFAIGPYECVEHLGEGAMGIVYKARHAERSRMCAVKVLSPDLAERPDAAAQFRREAELAARIQHPNTVLVYDFGELEGGLLYLVMELLEGRSLDVFAHDRAPLTADVSLSLTRQLCDGLDALHAAGILHRDLKPQNVMVLDAPEGDPRVKIVDFGLARLSSEALAYDASAPRITGTPLYMAPEQARGEPTSGASADVFSLAVVVFELVAGEPPFEVEGRTVSQVVLERASGQYRARRVIDVRPSLGDNPALEGLFTDALAPEAARRPSSAGAFYARMRASLAA
jgi:hypothetical protein